MNNIVKKGTLVAFDEDLILHLKSEYQKLAYRLYLRKLKPGQMREFFRNEFPTVYGKDAKKVITDKSLTQTIDRHLKDAKANLLDAHNVYAR